MAKITFTDAIGAATLQSSYPAPADRFANWVPTSKPFGEAARRQSDGALSMFKFRTDYGATFEIRGLRAHAVNGYAGVDLADRLIEWLLEGGTCEVMTEDVDSHVYATCGLMPETTPALQLADPAQLEYTLQIALMNLATAPERMVCWYDGMEITS